MRTLAIVTTSRADYGLYRPVLRHAAHCSDLRVRLIVGGMHLRSRFGMTVRQIEADGHAVAQRVDMLGDDDAPRAIAEAMGRGVAGFAAAFEAERPDLVMVLGDRFEMHAAALAALPLRIPVAHLHGGELTRGAIDDCLRHSITKLSHLHFVAAEPYRRRVIQLGEAPERVIVSGAPGIDNLLAAPRLDRRTLAARIGIDLPDRYLLASFHPVTLEHEQTARHVEALLAAIGQCGMTALFASTNADTGGRALEDALRGVRRLASLDSETFVNLMRHAAAMVGNSSAGLVEAPSLQLPVVNVGSRQAGRLRAANVIDVAPQADAIADAIQRAVSDDFRRSLAGMVNPYGDGRAAPRIVDVICRVDPATLIPKPFHDL